MKESVAFLEHTFFVKQCHTSTSPGATRAPINSSWADDDRVATCLAAAVRQILDLSRPKCLVDGVNVCIFWMLKRELSANSKNKSMLPLARTTKGICSAAAFLTISPTRTSSAPFSDAGEVSRMTSLVTR